MSAFLGPIHFWLYNKIQFQENLIDELVAYVTAKGWSDKADSTSAPTAANSMKSSTKPISTAGFSLVSTMPKAVMPHWSSMQPVTMAKNSTP